MQFVVVYDKIFFAAGGKFKHIQPVGGAYAATLVRRNTRRQKNYLVIPAVEGMARDGDMFGMGRIESAAENYVFHGNIITYNMPARKGIIIKNAAIIAVWVSTRTIYFFNLWHLLPR